MILLTKLRQLGYQLYKPAAVMIRIYALNGHAIWRLAFGHQPAGVYQNRSRAVYWDSKNVFGETVTSSLCFYTLTAGEFTTLEADASELKLIHSLVGMWKFIGCKFSIPGTCHNISYLR